MDRYSGFQDGMGEDFSASHGLYGQLHGRNHPLLLKGVDCRFKVTGDLATIHITQLFY
ncbi:MAG: hypothetical protein JNN07_27695 [Verrucomicrobiales bacterium]|nr:hypothetical protein [Verrucomicrobiales bacterium]